MVRVREVDAVIDGVVVSVPTMVIVQVPFAAVGKLGGGVEEPTPVQPEAARPTAVRTHSVARVASLRQRRPTKTTRKAAQP